MSKSTSIYEVIVSRGGNDSSSGYVEHKVFFSSFREAREFAGECGERNWGAKISKMGDMMNNINEALNETRAMFLSHR
jgi:hypothetical protein